MYIISKALYKIKSAIALKHRKDKKIKFKNQFTIISCNCIAGLLYHDYGLEFLSPTINLYIESPDFVKFVNNLREYLSYNLIEIPNAKYPIGLLHDIKVHFLHYTSFEEAKTKWDIRKKRINYDNIFVIMSDRDKYTDSLLDEFNKIPYKKVLFTHKKINNENAVFVKKDKKKLMVDDLTKFINLKGDRTYEYYFDFDNWLTGKYTVKECKKNE